MYILRLFSVPLCLRTEVLLHTGVLLCGIMVANQNLTTHNSYLISHISYLKTHILKLITHHLLNLISFLGYIGQIFIPVFRDNKIILNSNPAEVEHFF